MKIGILTHPLGANYGGILQAYALSVVLKDLGHSVTILRRDHDMPIYKRFIKQLLIAIKHPRYNSHKYIELRRFVDKNINESPVMYSSKQLGRYLEKENFGAVVVGSDQVWRADFALGFGYNYFLDFVPSHIKKISYAASFGLSSWNYDLNQTQYIKSLIERFSKVSVREYCGQKLCKDHLDYNAQVLLDPTMLLESSRYSQIASPRKMEKNYVYVYWLGNEQEKQQILKMYKGKNIIDISLRQNESLASIEDWLSFIKYADRIITDSFHGCVFSVLFNRQFVMYVNKLGGFGRIESLYKLLEIEYKLNDIYQDVDYKAVNEKIKVLRKESLKFLQSI